MRATLRATLLGSLRATLRATLLASLGLVIACGDARLYPLRRNTPGPTIICPDGQVGFAALEGGTTGGNDPAAPATPVTVDNAADFATYAGSTDPQIILVDGAGGLFAITGQIKVASNKTVIGVGNTAGFTGGGLDLTKSENVVIRNLVIAKALGTDAVTVNRSKHIWIDHCDFSSERDAPAGTYDGLVDITHGSNDMTISWTVFHDHRDTGVVGHTDDLTQMAEDVALAVTYHHNLFLRVLSGPRVRFGVAHVVNNEFEHLDLEAGDYGVASQMGAQVKVESNVFSAVNVPIRTQYNSPMDGFVNNVLNSYVPASAAGANIITMTTTWTPDNASSDYVYVPDSADSVSALVGNCAGVGKIQPGP